MGFAWQLRGFIVVLGATTAVALAHAQQVPRAAPVQFLQIGGEMAVDGHLDEPAWELAEPVTRFFEIYPENIAKPSIRTEARFLYDERFVYVGVTAYDADPDSIRSSLVRRDAIAADQDYIEVWFDALGSRRSALLFRTNPHGVATDAQYDEDSQTADLRPDLNFDVRASRNERGWTAEFRIPLATLRYETNAAPSWAVAVYRHRPRTITTTVSSAPVPRSTTCSLCFAAEARGISTASRPSSLYVTPQATYAHSDSNDEVKGGFDAKWLLRPDLALDLTFMPDYSQVEADDLQLTVNSRFATALQEKRPFFLEGVDLLRTPILAIYTRTFAEPEIGARLTKRGDTSEFAGLLLRDQIGMMIEPGALASQMPLADFPSTAILGRYKQNRGDFSWGALTSLRLNDEGSQNFVAGVDGTWAPTPVDRVGVQFLGSITDNPDRQDLVEAWSGQRLNGSAQAATWQHATDRWYTNVLYSVFSADFRSWNGYIPQVDVASTSASAGLFIHPGAGPFTTITPGLQYTQTQELGEAEITSDLAPSLGFSMPFNTELALSWHAKVKNRTEGGTHEFDYFSLSLATTPVSWMPMLSLAASYGDSVNLVTGTPGTATTLQTSVPLRLFDRLELKTSFSYTALDSAVDGHERRDFSQENTQLNALWHFSSKLYLQLLYQDSKITIRTLDSTDGQRHTRAELASALLSYQANWQTRYFIGIRVSSLDNGTEAASTSDTAVFAKVSYALPPF